MDRLTATTVSSRLVSLVAIACVLWGCGGTGNLNGVWELDTGRSSDIDQWRAVTLTIQATAESVRILKLRNAGRYSRTDSIDVAADGEPHALPMAPSAKWLDQVHLGVFVGEGATRMVRATWDEYPDALTVESTLPLKTSTGDATVTVVAKYTLGEEGNVLTVTEKRSSRDETLTYVYTRKRVQ